MRALRSFFMRRWLGMLLRAPLGPAEAPSVARAVAQAWAPWRRHAALSDDPSDLSRVSRLLWSSAVLLVLLYREIERRHDSQRAGAAVTTIVHSFSRRAAALLLPGPPVPSGDPWRLFKRRLMALNNRLAPAIRGAVVRDDAAGFRWDVHTCRLARVCRALDAPEVGAIYCAFDDIFFASYDPRIGLHRAGTIARGDRICDFAYSWRADGR